MDNSDSDPMVMSTLETLEMPVMDEYDREEMEWIEELEDEGEFRIPEPERVWDIPAFHDVSAWDVNNLVEEYYDGSTRRSFTLAVGSTFSSKAEAIYAVQKYSILNRVEYMTIESEPRLLVPQCREGVENCPWRVRIAMKKNASYWEVRKYKGDHVCTNDKIINENVHLNRHFIAREIGDIISERLRLTVGEIRARIFKDYGCDIKYLKAWQAKQQALKNLFGDWDESFGRLPLFMQALQDSNDETVVRWVRYRDDESGKMIVHRVFWAFGPSIRAFTHCRPVLCVDGTHMYGKYEGKLLVAVALDANNHILPVSFALVESENNNSWKWFMQCIREGVTDRDGICVISDRHKGIIAAMQEPDWSPPRGYHRVCIRHLQSNFNIKVKDSTLKKKLGHIAHQRQQVKFDKEYQELIGLLRDRPRVIEWLESIPWSKWSLAYDEGGLRWGSMTTNASECFNNILRGARDLPICAVVLFTFYQCNEYFCKRRELYLNSASILAPRIDLILRDIREKALFHRVTVFDATRGVFQVLTTQKHHIHEVRLEDGTCTCGKWVAFHYPCSHVMAVCKSQHIPYIQFVSEYYTLETFHQTWSYSFYVIADESRWRPYEGLKHVPAPGFKRSILGRQPSVHRRNEMDRGESSSQGATRVQKCGLCHNMGHNRRSCPNKQ